MPKISARQETLSQIDELLQTLIIMDSFELVSIYENEINELLELKAHISSFRYFCRNEYHLYYNPYEDSIH